MLSVVALSARSRVRRRGAIRRDSSCHSLANVGRHRQTGSRHSPSSQIPDRHAMTKRIHVYRSHTDRVQAESRRTGSIHSPDGHMLSNPSEYLYECRSLSLSLMFVCLCVSLSLTHTALLPHLSSLLSRTTYKQTNER